MLRKRERKRKAIISLFKSSGSRFDALASYMPRATYQTGSSLLKRGRRRAAATAVGAMRSRGRGALIATALVEAATASLPDVVAALPRAAAAGEQRADGGGGRRGRMAARRRLLGGPEVVFFSSCFVSNQGMSVRSENL